MNTVNKDLILHLESKKIIEYVELVINAEWESDEDKTIPLLLTQSYGLLSPNRVFELIDLGVITVIKHAA